MLKKQERISFEATKLDAAQKSIHVFAGIASVCNFLFLVGDLFFISGRAERMVVALTRYCFSILLVLLTRRLQRMRTFAAFTALVTVLEATAVVLYLLILRLYEAPDFMVHSLGVILMILVIFIVPNRSVNMLVLWLLGSAAYFGFAHYYIRTMSSMQFIAACIYATLTIVICAVKALGNDRYAFREFRAKARLEQASSKDFLTSAVTRARLEEEAYRWMNFCRRQGLPLCMVFVDVDDLKQINDRYGHTMGDAALKSVAGIMRAQLRNSDTIARWGGDEFVLLLPNVTLQNAVLLLDRVKFAISCAELDGGVTVSCSFGVVQMGPESTYAQMLSEADEMMYRSKRGGKGRIGYSEALHAQKQGQADACEK